MEQTWNKIWNSFGTALERTWNTWVFDLEQLSFGSGTLGTVDIRYLMLDTRYSMNIVIAPDFLVIGYGLLVFSYRFLVSNETFIYNEFFRSKHPLININRGEKGKMGKLFLGHDVER